jgi:hypothetical protein
MDPEEKKLAAFPVAFFDTREKPDPGSKDLAGKTINRRRATPFQYGRAYIKTGGDQGCRTVKCNGDNG